MKSALKQLRFKFLFLLTIGIFFQCSVNSPESKFVNTLIINTKKIKGRYIFQWNQINQHGNQVSNDDYFAVLTLVQKKHSTSFKIKSDFPHVPEPYGSAGRINFPFNPPISVNFATYSKGDTGCIQFEVDSSQTVLLHIEKE